MLAKAYRFLIDPRDRRDEEILKKMDDQRGVWGCKTVFNCVAFCPKEVPPTYAIVKMRWRILKYKASHLVSSFSRRFQT
jgi:succinate dehydrogenase / fumarate reductase iron-sulfur subunit